MKKPARRKCKICCEWFMPKYQNIWWCNPEHGTELAIRKRNRDREKAERALKKKQQQELTEQKDKLKARKLAVKHISYFKNQAQQAFNEFIRLRDHEQPCISCGETNPPDLFGGQWDCGHFLSVGSHPELRFEEKNAYKQCKSCNGGSGKFSHKNKTVSQQYEENLIERFGQELIDWLRGPHEMTNYRKEDFIRIRDEYRAKVRNLKKKIL
ncbi:recombination protein NinG [Photorhabdus luminescens]|uniref:recombination protein NinG n=1 Tax=Photorhabdus luminescens TaxID=29488 RepID=UPI002240AD95|nr:recombination protein NinG [Photorhabdus luminescens]MCW7764438.1 recombination protein NinG [Photorhabdus luminescens subsp. venezuelensis]